LVGASIDHILVTGEEGNVSMSVQSESDASAGNCFDGCGNRLALIQIGRHRISIALLSCCFIIDLDGMCTLELNYENYVEDIGS
jgi:hypothetical protein